MRDVERAINVMDENTERLSKAMPTMLEADQELAQLYLERIGQMQSLFRFAQLIITSILAKSGEMDFNDVSRIEIE